MAVSWVVAMAINEHDHVFFPGKKTNSFHWLNLKISCLQTDYLNPCHYFSYRGVFFLDSHLKVELGHKRSSTERCAVGGNRRTDSSLVISQEQRGGKWGWQSLLCAFFVCKCSSHATRLQSPSSWSWTKSYFLRTLSGRSLRSWRAGMSWSNNTGANRHKEPGTQAPPVVWDPCFFVHSWPKHQLVSCSLYIHPHITQQPRLSFHFHRIITIPTLPCQATRFLNPKRHPPTLKPNLS